MFLCLDGLKEWGDVTLGMRGCEDAGILRGCEDTTGLRTARILRDFRGFWTSGRCCLRISFIYTAVSG